MGKHMNNQFKFTKTTITAASAVAFALLSGCASKSIVAEPDTGMPDSAYVVAKNLPQALDRSEARIQKNEALLRELEQKKSFSVQPVEHVQQLDARSASDKRKIIGPQFPVPAPVDVAGNNMGNNMANSMSGPPGVLNGPGLTPVVPVNPNTPVSTTAPGAVQPLEVAKDIVGTDNAKVAKLNTPIRSVEWKNSSFNDFVRKIGTHVGYTVVVIDKAGNTISNRDTLLSLQENNKTPLAILSKAADMNQSTLTLTVSHVRQKIIIAYK